MSKGLVVVCVLLIAGLAWLVWDAKQPELVVGSVDADGNRVMTVGVASAVIAHPRRPELTTRIVTGDFAAFRQGGMKAVREKHAAMMPGYKQWPSSTAIPSAIQAHSIGEPSVLVHRTPSGSTKTPAE